MSKASQLSALLSSMKVIDLSQTLEENMPVVESHSRYYHTLIDSFETGSIALAYQLLIGEHCGTHMDATAHFIHEGHPAHRYMDETPVEHFFGRALTLDFSHYTETNAVTPGEIERWERENQPIRQGDIVLFRFGWDRYWVPRTVSRDYSRKWPGITGEAAELLVARGVKTVGCDAIAIDGSKAPESPAHYALLGNGVNIVENLTNLDQIVGESVVFIAPLKVKTGSGAPMRALAFV
ncbi:cyclase family protein [Paenibacillus humicola]|uniref:cyclase family protein n=1 Tax=Paenibacillus humicola TaxID=3110540 RepID=UPI00237C2773|nr:cyclase family protein [Paenibacillus humicola]